MTAKVKAKADEYKVRGARYGHYLEPGPVTKASVLVVALIVGVIGVESGGSLPLAAAAWMTLVWFQWSRKRKQSKANAIPFHAVDDEPFVLFLRPFKAPDRLASRVNVRGYVERIVMGEFWDIELALAFAIRNRARLVAIGDPKHAVGAIKVISSDATWKEKFKKLSEAAQSIVMVPSPSQSVGWELETIRQSPELLKKTIFVMPPRPLRPSHWPLLAFGGGPGRFWKRTQRVFSKKGIALPAYNADGIFFTLREDGQVERLIDAGEFYEEWLNEVVLDYPKHRVLQGMAQRPWWDRFPWNRTPLHPSTFGMLTSLAVLILVVSPFWLILTTFFFDVRSIPSESMAPSLQVGDRVAVAKFAYGFDRTSLPFGAGALLGDKKCSEETSAAEAKECVDSERLFPSMPHRGDVIVFQHPHSDRVMIKRLIGLPGDTIEVKQGLLYLNGSPLPRDKVRTTAYVPDGENRVLQATEYRQTIPTGERDKDGKDKTKSFLIHEFSDSESLDETPIFKVPPGHVFMMGDNRDNSEDSRAPSGHRSMAAAFPNAWPYRGTGLPADTKDDAIGFVPMDYLIGRAETVLFTLHDCKQAPGAECTQSRVWRAL